MSDIKPAPSRVFYKETQWYFAGFYSITVAGAALALFVLTSNNKRTSFPFNFKRRRLKHLKAKRRIEGLINYVYLKFIYFHFSSLAQCALKHPLSGQTRHYSWCLSHSLKRFL